MLIIICLIVMDKVQRYHASFIGKNLLSVNIIFSAKPNAINNY